jgi:hypothetical protein
MAASRAKLGDFRLTVTTVRSLPRANAILPAQGSVVSRKGNHWRIDSSWPMAGANAPRPLYVCDGTRVWKNANVQGDGPPQWEPARHPAPQDLMSGEGLGALPLAPHVKLASLLYPDLSPEAGWGFEFDPQPAEAPGCVLLKRSARLATAEPLTGHEWYYIDPAKGHAVVRAELFNLPTGKPADPSASPTRQTILLEDFQQSPQGAWYCCVVHNSTSTSGNEPGSNGRARSSKTTIQYQFNFSAELPEDLFTIEQ